MMAIEPVAPPVTVTSQLPPAAASVTVMLATTVVALLAVALFTVTPLQPNATARLSIALALTPASVIVTSPVNPASTDAGLTLAHLGQLASSLKLASTYHDLCAGGYRHIAGCINCISCDRNVGGDFRCAVGGCAVHRDAGAAEGHR